MKKRNLATAVLTCALCVIVMAGTACAPQVSCVDDPEPAAAASAAEAEPMDATTESAIDDEATVEPAQEEGTAQTEVEAIAPANPKGEGISGAKPAAQAASQPEAKKASQNSAAASKQQPQAKPAAASLEAESGEEEADDEILMVIDAIPAGVEEAPAKPRTITINGVAIDYVDSFGTSSAPEQDAGLWMGSDSTTDGSFGYFIGHNNTDFGDVANLKQGSVVSVTDGNGDSCDYEVVDSFVVPRGTLWSEVSDRVAGRGESIAMQTCVDDGYLIVIAE